MFMAIWTLHKVGTSVKLCSSSPGGRWSLRGCVLLRLRWQCAPGPSGHHNGDTAFTRRSAYNIGGPRYAGSLNFRMQSWVGRTSCTAERRLAAHGADKDSGRLCHWPICQSCVRLIDWPMTG